MYPWGSPTTEWNTAVGRQAQRALVTHTTGMTSIVGETLLCRNIPYNSMTLSALWAVETYCAHTPCCTSVTNYVAFYPMFSDSTSEGPRVQKVLLMKLVPTTTETFDNYKPIRFHAGVHRCIRIHPLSPKTVITCSIYIGISQSVSCQFLQSFCFTD